MGKFGLKWRRRLCLALGAVPLLLKLPYLAAALRNSPLDRVHLLAGGAAAAFAALAAIRWRAAARRGLEAARGFGLPAWFALAACAAGFAAGAALRINALQLMAAMGIWWSATWLAYGWRLARLLLPALAVAALAAPGMTQWIGGVRGKVALREYAPCRPEFAALAADGWLGREMPPDAAFRLYFGDGASRYRYALGETTFDVIVLDAGRDVHNVHPAAHCLRSSGWQIEAERLMSAQVGGVELQYGELVARRGAARALVWAWYSSPEQSTGSFVRFRSQCGGGEGWRAYLVSCPLADGADVPGLRRRIAELVAEFSRRLTDGAGF